VLRRKLPGINDRIVNAFLTKLEAKAILFANVPKELSMPEFTVNSVHLLSTKLGKSAAHSTNENGEV